MNASASGRHKLKKPYANILSILVVLVLTLSTTGSVQAAGPWYVAPVGSDSNSCTSAGEPCLTINGAIAKATAGDTINVTIGTYTGTGNEVVLINKNITLLGGWDAGFTTRSGLSTIDGQQARRGITIYFSASAVVDRFAIQNGFDSYSGGGIYVWGDMLTLNDSVVSGNTAGQPGGPGGGGGIAIQSSPVTLNNTTVSGNTVVGDVRNGSGIANTWGTLTLNNSTISGNTGYWGIDNNNSGNVTLNNSTVTGNTGGIINLGGTFTVRNGLIAGNSGPSNLDCLGTFASAGYNLIGNADQYNCIFPAAIGDQVGTSASPIDPRLGPLQDNGGPTRTHALLKTSPAVNAGNPAEPGGGADACLPADQRGVPRPVDGRCDIGAYEGAFTAVTAINRADPSPTSKANVTFTVTFSEAVTGVTTVAPFEDFALATTGVTGAAISAVSGSGDTYTVTVETGKGNGTVWLNLVDDDSILDGSAIPLGGPGAGNGNFTGQAYTIRKIPVTQTPKGTTWDRTPTYKWSTIPGATKYTYELWMGTARVYTKTILATACGAAACANTPATVLAPAGYKWRVRALASGVWQPFSAYRAFTVAAPRAGYWRGSGVDFYVTPDRAYVKNFSIYVSVSGCGNYRITRTVLTPVVKGKFKFTGAFYAQGTFSTIRSVSGTLGVKNLYLAPCRVYLTGGPFSWSATWINSNQLDPMTDAELMVVPELEGTLPGPFRIEPVEP